MPSKILLLLLLLLLAKETLAESVGGGGLSLEFPSVLYMDQLVRFNCSVDGTSAGGNFTWSRDNIALLGGSSGQLEVVVRADWNGSTLTCMEEGGSCASQDLTVYSLSPTFLAHPVSKTVRVGEPLFTCHALGLPPPMLAILKDDAFFDGGESIITRNSTEDDSGNYTCMATNSEGHITSPPALIRVKFPPEIDTSPVSMDVLNNSVAVLNCSARGYPPPVYSWLRNGEPVDVSDGRLMTLANGSLLISPVMMVDMGLYQCEASNELGSGRSDEVMLMVDVFPRFLRTPTDMSAVFPNMVELTCEASAIPEPEYLWLNCTEGEVPVTLSDRVFVETNGSLIFTNTTRDDAGTYKCVAMNEHGNITSSPAMLTVIAPPLPPLSLRAGAITSSTLEIRWNSPPNANPPVLHYFVEYKLTFEPEYVTLMETGTRVTLIGLYPVGNYSVRVSAENSLGHSDTSEALEVMTSTGPVGAGLLDGPGNVSVESVTSTSFTLRWDIPQVLFLTSYVHSMLRVVAQDGSEDTVQMAQSPHTVTSRVPATPYTASLTFIFMGGYEGTPVNASATTVEDVPGDAPVIITSVALNHSAIQVAWSPPSRPNGVITHFTIYHPPSPVPVIVGGGVMTFDLSELRPFTNYTISLSANTSVGEGPRGPVGGVVVETEQDIPPAPSGLVVSTTNSTAIIVTWQPFNEGDVPGILTNFTVRYNQLHHGGHPVYVRVDPDQTTAVLAGLLPFTEYHVMVAASTEAGLGPFTDMESTRTLGDRPQAVLEVTDVMEICPSGLLIRWTPPHPTLLGGPEDQVEYVLTFMAEGTPVANVTFPFDPMLTNYTLLNVLPFIRYSLQLALQNANGTGESSRARSIVSCDGAAAPPLNVTLQTLNSTALSVTWAPPPSVLGVIIGYSVRYRRTLAQLSVEEVFTTGSQLVLSGLAPFTSYTVCVATQTRGPLGNYSSDQLAMTQGDVPAAPVTAVMVTAVCPANLLVSWTDLADEDLRASPQNSIYLVTFNSSLNGEMLEVPFSDGPMVNLTGLALAVNYTVVVRAVNEYGPGPPSSPQLQSTLTVGLPTVPSNVSVSAQNGTALLVTWVGSGDMEYYMIMYEPTDGGVRSNLSTSLQSVFLLDLSPFTNYSITVTAMTMCGGSNQTQIMGATPEALPSVPLGIEVIASLPTRIKVQWDVPTSPNGIITHYNVYCNTTTSVSVQTLFHECEGLVPQANYTITLSAVNGAGEGPPVLVPAATSCSPSIPDVKSMGGVVRVGLTDSCFTSHVLYVLVLVQELTSSDGKVQPPSRSLEDYSINELKTLTLQYAERFDQRRRRQAPEEQNGVYIAANITEELMESEFILGDGLEYGVYTNHPLTAGVFYNVVLRGAVDGTDTPLFANASDPIMVVSGEELTTTVPPAFPLIPVAAAAGAAGLLILAICMAACISCLCCCCSRSLDKQENGSPLRRYDRSGSFRLSVKKKLVDPVEEYRANNLTEALEDHPPIPVFGFINRLMVMKTNDNQLFLEEFGSIPMTVAGLSTDVASSSANKPRNRYNNILPYDATRVKVKGQSTDYINANFCSGYRKPKAYIATQGPLQITVGDFWRMMWEENVHTIVMLTNVQEKGKVKCEMYWPREVGSSAVHGQLDVTFSAVTTLADYTIRTFSLLKVGSSKEAREVVQFHFTSWPDHGVPQYATAMLAMIRRVRRQYSPETGPMVVHCSAGVGRTGTFIVIDSMLQRLAQEEEIVDIYGHVSLLRSQRNYMVQTEDQYFFIHEAVAEALLCGNTEVPLDHLPDYVTDLCSAIPDDESDITNLELQFKRLALDRNDPNRWVTASKDANKAKNRFVNVLPYDTSRVYLNYSPGVDGSDYINASFVDSYHTRKAFIATQGPLRNTVDDFWRMLWQYSVPVVVMLTEEVERGHECSACYWPQAILQPVTYGKYSVELNVERNSGTYTYRDLAVSDTTGEGKKLIRHFQFHGWPEVGVPTPSVLVDFLREVQKLCQSLSTQWPIVVHCSNGVGRTGVFISLHIILERLLVEGLVDVFQTVKNLRIQRPAMVQTLEQYHFCYDATATFLQLPDIVLPTPVSAAPRRSSSQRSRHGSHSSVDSRKKSKNATPISPTRSGSLRNTPIRSESMRDSNLDLRSNGGSHVYGGSEATSTFGSHITSDLHNHSKSLPQDSVDLAGAPLDANIVGSTTPQHPALVHHQPGGSHTPVTSVHPPVGSMMPQLTGPQTPVPSVHQPVGSQTPVPSVHQPVGSQTPVPSVHQPVGSQTPVPSVHQPVGPQTPVPSVHQPVGPQTALHQLHGPTSQSPMMYVQPTVAQMAVLNSSYPAGAHTPVLQLREEGNHNSPLMIHYETSSFNGSQTPVLSNYEGRTTHTPFSLTGDSSLGSSQTQLPSYSYESSSFGRSQTPPVWSGSSQQTTSSYLHPLVETQRQSNNDSPHDLTGEFTKL